MPAYTDTRFLPYPWEDLYRLVADIPSYPQFLPWCAGARLLSPMPDAMQGGEVLAELLIRFKIFQESYVSRVRMVVADSASERPEAASITATLERGPFSHMNSHWRFIPKGDRLTEVHFGVDFAFQSPLLNKAIGGLFGSAVQKMSHAFEKRAQMLLHT